ncbi:MAG: tryptophanyl-tRNA synthetase [Thermotogaceae bacterium]|nr:tryptophanyl-tRNA synthetase [Thermotogaceae bacterium]
MRIVSGSRPTGKLHIGHYVGILENWVRLQNEGFETFYFVADWHALTTGYDETQNLAEYSKELIRMFMAAGLDPEKSVLFVQSAIKEHAELQLLFSMLTSVSRLERVPTYKEQKQQMEGNQSLANAGFLTYPVLQAADILIYKGEAVPVGEDQLSHVELTREVARKFNYTYNCEVFPEPESKLSHTPKLPGTDGRKMSKSYGNIINIESTPEELKKAIMPMITDPARKRKSDPGNPEICPVWSYHKAFRITEEDKKWVFNGCTKAEIGCVQCKKLLLQNMEKTLTPVWENLVEIDAREGYVDDVIYSGNKRAREIAKSTMHEVRNAMNLLF